MTLTIGRQNYECEMFKVRGSYNITIARLFGLPAAVASKEPLTLEITVKGNSFRPYKNSRRVYWNRKFVGFFVLGPLIQEWDGDKYKTKLELKQCERSDIPEDDVPNYKWRFDLLAISQNYKPTDGAILAAGREVDPFANSWKANSIPDRGGGSSGGTSTPSVLPIARGGTEADTAVGALDKLGAIPLVTKGIPGGVAPLGMDGKVPSSFLPTSGGSGIPVAEKGAAGGVAPLDNTSKVPLTYLPAYPTLSSLNAISTAEKGANNGVAPLDGTGKVSSTFLPAYPTLSSLDGIPIALIGVNNGLAPLDGTGKVPAGFLPAYPTLSSLNGIPLSEKGANNGVAPLDNNAKISTTYLPFNFFVLTPRNTTAINVNNVNPVSGSFASVQWIDAISGNTNLPPGFTSGVLEFVDPLRDTTDTATATIQEMASGGRFWKRQKSGTSWLDWQEIAFLNNQTLVGATSPIIQNFTGQKEFSGGMFATNAAAKTDVRNTGLTRNSLYFSNPSQAGGQRQSRINYASNGNIQIQILSDDTNTVTAQWEFTASGNMIVPAVLRFQSYTSNPTGASFHPGGVYWNSNLGTLVVSNGTSWFRVTLGAVVP
jgi:hypothetical protein